MRKFDILKYAFVFFSGMGAGIIGWSLFHKKSLSRTAGFFLGGIILGALFFVDIYWVEPNWIEVTTVEIHDLPLARSLKGLKIVQISDIHVNHGLGKREKEMVRMVNELHPDLILLTGDYFDSFDQVAPIVELFKELKARIGIWGVPGNTDYISIDDSNKTARLLQASGVRILVNEAARIKTDRGYFWLIGVDENVYHHDRLSSALMGVPRNEPRVLLAHSPTIFDQAVREEINLVLAGHTHGGQVGVPFLIELSKYANRTTYMRGLFEKGKTKLYVNRGIGMKTLPIRFLCRPEITVLKVDA